MINGSTSLICLIGHPVSHSSSPKLHNYLFDKYNLNYKYVCFDVLENELQNAIKGIRALNIKGANVTVPHKINVIKYLDELDESAKIVGSVNTIKNSKGKLIGYNTDGVGFMKSLKNQNISANGKNIMILGAGGAARGIASCVCADNPKSLTIRNRSKDKACSLASALSENFDLSVKFGDLNIKASDFLDIDILINTTSVGMSPDFDSIPIDKNIKITNNMSVCDIIYNPCTTKLLEWASENKCKTVGGSSMLINQGLKAFTIWTDINVSESDITDFSF